MANDHLAPPPLDAMLGAASRLLEAEVLPLLEGRRALQLRMVIRQLRIGARELRHGPQLCRQEHQSLQALDGASTSLQEGRARLARRIRNRQTEGDPQQLRDHVACCARDLLSIDNPNWAAAPPNSNARVRPLTSGDKS